MLTAVCFGKTSSENEQTNCRKDWRGQTMVISYGSSFTGRKKVLGVYFINYNLGHNILELYNVLVHIPLTTLK